jgi:hypothetical protein
MIREGRIRNASLTIRGDAALARRFSTEDKHGVGPAEHALSCLRTDPARHALNCAVVLTRFTSGL